MTPTIRKMTMRDHDRVIALWKGCEGLGLTDTDSREGTRAFLRRNPGLSFVAEKDGRIVGTAMSGHDGRRGFIYHVAVAPSERRHGLGRNLVARCLTGLAEARIPKCHIVVYARNRAGRKFWRNIGWVERAELTMMSRLTG